MPTILDYHTHLDKRTMFNTLSIFPIIVLNETLKWLKDIDGVEVMQKINRQKADMIYAEIDHNSMFVGTAEKDSHLNMKV